MTKTIRKMKNAWTTDELDILRANWGNGTPIKDWMHLLPSRSHSGIQARAREIGLGSRGKVSRIGRSITWKLICKLLADGKPRSTKEVAEEIEISRRSIDHCMRLMHGKGIRVGDWGPQGLDGVRSRLWILGFGPDVPRPPTPSRAERASRRWREIKKDPVRLAIRTARLRLKTAEQKGLLIRRDPAAAWF
ncbi:hypothetical protein BKK79_00755 [Cupriavidus sp. USMAA2-4]|uniref:hypothetical protein n=1 Tax=Cupriavidus sp. USMAA2-4 TaxID=876364 RepID=UPI0008A71232|nr:hypothetical protein [Cupriavidus sp. USMAA2-4]AOY90519.1 hypothetical protein BKK79_00755 [Cupriavidus sp. USMAA2-4]